MEDNRFGFSFERFGKGNRDGRRPPIENIDSDVTVADSDTSTPPAMPDFGFKFHGGFHRPPFDSDVTVSDTDTDTATAPSFEQPNQTFFGEPDDEPWFAREDNFFAPNFDFNNGDLSSIINKPMSAPDGDFDDPNDFQRIVGGKRNNFLSTNHQQFNRRQERR